MDAAQPLPVAEHLAARRRDQPGQDAQQCRLATARRTEHRDDLAFTDRKADVAQHSELATVAVKDLRDGSRFRDRRFVAPVVYTAHANRLTRKSVGRHIVAGVP